MHPAYSIIFFTTASGAGYGLMALLGLLAPLGYLPTDRLFGFSAIALALGLISAGLFSSTAHLGRPERVWRALSQWRSSWLSREGISAFATFLPAGVFALGWGLLGRTDGWFAATGAVSAILSLVTISFTAMIYASLKPVPEWHNLLTLPSYLVFAVMTGLTLLNVLLQMAGAAEDGLLLVTIIVIAAAWAWKLVVWWRNDRTSSHATAASAIGMPAGNVRSVEWPHTEENYLLKEMGYRLARKHSARLRMIVQAAAFCLPLTLLLLGRATDGWIVKALSVIAAFVQCIGILVERWLFFAEAQHLVMNYYGR